jgi:parallel beta-helix repeat protein
MSRNGEPHSLQKSQSSPPSSEKVVKGERKLSSLSEQQIVLYSVAVLMLFLVMQPANQMIAPSSSDPYIPEVLVVPPESSVTAVVAHGPIYITSDDAFAAKAASEGWQGSGVAEDPYIIENYEITSWGYNGYLIDIRNTRVHFIIRNCILVGDWVFGSIFLYNVMNAVISDNICRYNLVSGIILSLSDDNIIINNTCNSNDNDGIGLDSSENNLIFNNTCSYNQNNNIFMEYSRGNRVINNTCTFSAASNGIVVGLYSGNSLVVNNTCTDNSDFAGIFVAESIYSSTISNNTCSDNYYGMFFSTTADGNSISWNAFIDNTIDVQDLSSGNQFEYNYYSGYAGDDADEDGIGDVPYVIPGAGNSIDMTPLMIPPGTPVYWVDAPQDKVLQPCEQIVYNLNASAGYPGVDTWWLDDTTHFNIDKHGIITKATYLVDGSYPLQVWVNDTWGHTITASFKITVIGYDSPDWVEEPTDQIAELGYWFRYDLNATDPSGIDQWWVDDVLHFSVDGNGVVTNATVLPLGETYPLRVWVNDTLGNALTTLFWVTVKDTVGPGFVPPIINQFVDLGQGFRYDINATDMSGVDVSSWWINDTTNFIIDSDGVITNITALSEGFYGIRISVSDVLGHVRIAEFTLDVGISIRVAVLQSYLTIEPEALEYLNLYWGEFGRIRIIIDYTTLDIETITLEALEACGADVLIMSTSIEPYSDNELLAIMAYLRQGHGLFATGRCLQDSPEWFTRAFGLADGIVWHTTSASEFTAVIPNHPLLTRMPAPFYAGFSYLPEDTGWDSSALDGATYVALEASGAGRCAILTYQGMVYCSHTPMWYPAGWFEYQLAYNAICWTKYVTPDIYWVQYPVDQTLDIGVDFSYDLNATSVSGTVSWTINDTLHFNIDSLGRITNITDLLPGSYGMQVWADDGTGNIISENFTILIVKTFRVAVLRGYYTNYPSSACWEYLNQNWQEFGTSRVIIDYTSLTMQTITLEDLMNSNADVLIMGYDCYLSDAELSAVMTYVQLGHGFVATSTAFLYATEEFSEFFGITHSGFEYMGSAYEFDILEPEHPLFTDITYLSPYPSSYYPYSGWTDAALDGATYVAVAQTYWGDNIQAIIVYQGMVYCSNRVEYGTSYSQVTQFVYNAICWSKYTQPDHDVTIALEVSSSVKPDVTELINATVYNLGLSDEVDVSIQLYINDTLVDSLIIPILAKGTSQALTYLWTPTLLGHVNITAVVSTVPLEEQIGNNRVMQEVQITTLHDYTMAEGVLMWYDAMTLGINLHLSADDGTIPLALLFDFQFYESTFDTVYISSNGRLTFAYEDQWDYSNVAFPSDDYRYTYTIAPFWDDLICNDNVYAWITDQWVVIQYSEVTYYEGGIAGTFQVILFADGRIAFSYLEIFPPFSATVGLNLGNGVNYNSYPDDNVVSEDGETLWFIYDLTVHDLAASVEAPSAIGAHKDVLLNTTVWNLGGSLETNIMAYLLIDDIIVESRIITELASFGTYTFEYLWTPAESGIYNITAYVVPVSGELLTNNNNETMICEVLRYINILTPENGQTVSGGLVYIEYQAPRLDILSEIIVYINDNPVAAVSFIGTTSLYVPVFLNGTNTIHLEAHWEDSGVAIAEVVIDSIGVVKIAFPEIGDYIHWRQVYDDEMEDYNFTVVEWLTEYDINVTLTYHRFDQTGTLELAEYWLVVDTINGWVRESNMWWHHERFFFFTGLGYPVSAVGSSTPFWSWGEVLTVNGSGIWEGHAIWTLNSTLYDAVSYGILRSTGLLTTYEDANLGILGFITDSSMLPPFDVTSPEWTELPSDQSTEFGSVFVYDLNAVDPSGIDTWWLSDLTWFNIDQDGVIRNQTLLPVGIYVIQVSVNDTLDNVLTTTFTLTVSDTTSPVWIEIPMDQTCEAGTEFSFQLNAYDLAGIQHYWINDMTLFSVNENGLVTSLYPLSAETYTLEVRAYDFSNNYCSAEFSVLVLDSTPPEWTEEPTDQILEYGQDLSYDLNAVDISGLSEWWIDDTAHFSIDQEGSIRSIVLLEVGQYQLLMSVADSYGNVLYAEITVLVIDSTPPIWLTEPTDQELLGNEILDCGLLAYDISGISMWTINDTTRFTIDVEEYPDFSLGRIRSNEALDPGIYGLLVEVTDIYGNVRSCEFSVTVTQSTQPTQQIEMQLSGSFDYVLKEKIHLQIAAMLKDAATGRPISGATVTATIYGPEFDDKGDEYEERFVMTVTLVEEVPGSGVYIFTTEETMKDMDLEKGIYIVYCTAHLENGAEVVDMMQFHIDPPGDTDVPSQTMSGTLFIAASVGVIVSLVGLITYAYRGKRKVV